MRYAIMESGGKQYIAREGETIEVDRLPLEIGKPVEFDQVLLAVNGKEILVGSPLIKGVSVKAKVVEQIKAKKIIVFKYVPKQRYRRKAGHRQKYTRVVVDEISFPSTKKDAAKKESAKEKPAPKKKATKKKSTAKASAKKTTAKKSTAKKSSSKASGSSTSKKTSVAKSKKGTASKKKSASSSKKGSSKSTKKSSDS
jgi:large subunit ribosomal protein L21